MFDTPNVPSGQENCFIEDLTIGAIPATEVFDKVLARRKASDTWVDGTFDAGAYETFFRPFLSGNDNIGDELYFGSATTFDKLNVLGVVISQFQLAYWDGSDWVDLSMAVLSGVVEFTPPGDWTPLSVNGSPDLYYLRATSGMIPVQYPEPGIEIAYK
jgi:hypothetical protein